MMDQGGTQHRKCSNHPKASEYDWRLIGFFLAIGLPCTVALVSLLIEVVPPKLQPDMEWRTALLLIGLLWGLYAGFAAHCAERPGALVLGSLVHALANVWLVWGIGALLTQAIGLTPMPLSIALPTLVICSCAAGAMPFAMDR